MHKFLMGIKHEGLKVTIQHIRDNMTYCYDFMQAADLLANTVARYQNDPTTTHQIKAIDTRLDPVTRSVKVHALVPNEQLELRPGMLLNVSVTLAEVQALQVSEKAIVPLQNKQYVFVVNKDNSVTQTEVQLGQRIPGLVEIVSGLNAGDEVVIEGTTKIRTGSLITKVGQ